MNAIWHRKHRLRKNAELERRLQWHLQHDVHCGCRPMPRSLKRELLRQIAAGRPRPGM
jgi:hypothetical protein